MALRPSFALLSGLAVWAAGVAALLLALQRDAPLFLNLGAGDAPFARGFRGGWERDGLAGGGETMFHWTEDGSRLEFPVTVEGDALEARIRLARFAPGDASVTLLAGTEVVERFTQAPRGWSVRRFQLGGVRGPLMLRFRSESAGEGGLGLALDWAEVSGATRVWPRPELSWRIAVVLFVLPAVLAGFMGLGSGAWLGAFAAWCGAAAVLLDRLGGLVALSEAALPALVAASGLGLAHLLLRYHWFEQFGRRAACAIPAAGVLAACLLLFHPFFYYPDVDTHARFLGAIRGDPWTLVDPGDFQARHGAWMRTIGGHKLAFPYSPAFHLAAWPLALVLGDVAAVKTLAAFGIGLTLLATFGLCRALLLAPAWGFASQLLVALLPVTASRLSLALFPALLAQALEALLALHLVRRFGHLDGARDAAAASFFLFAVQAAYTGSLINVAALVYAFAAIEALAGEHRRALRLVTTHAVAAAAVVALLYLRFLFSFVRMVLPSAFASGDTADVGAAQLLHRLVLFYDGVVPLLAVLGLFAVAKAPVHARRWAWAALGAGTALLLLRGLFPSLLRDAKEVEMLAVPAAVLSSAALQRLWASNAAGKLAVAVALVAALLTCVPKDVASYEARFVAVDR